MANVFISHSRRDEELVAVISKALINIGHNPIVEEFIPEEKKESVPYEEIMKNVGLSNYIFLLLTDNILATGYTRNWVTFEVGLAARDRKRVFVFERTGVPIPYPIPYLTDYTVFDADSTNDILSIQGLAKKLNELPKRFVGAGAGLLVGAPFGPLGLIIGGLGGLLLGASAEEQILKVQCHHCKVSFNYYSAQYNVFLCPACRSKIYLNPVGGQDG